MGAKNRESNLVAMVACLALAVLCLLFAHCGPKYVHLWQHFGLYEGEILLNYLEKKIAEKTQQERYTLGQLFKDKGIWLRLGVCNVTTGRFEFLDYKTHPNMPIALAARASSSIPVVF